MTKRLSQADQLRAYEASLSVPPTYTPPPSFADHLADVRASQAHWARQYRLALDRIANGQYEARETTANIADLMKELNRRERYLARRVAQLESR